MKIYLIDNKSIGAPNIAEAMRSKGWDVTVKQTDINGQRHNIQIEEEIDNEIKRKNYDVLFSFNFYPIIAEVCHRCGLRYVSWIYDSPLVALYSYTMIYDTNYIFLFDYVMYNELKRIGLQRVFYMPLASNTLNSPFIKREEYNNYPQMPISFVGSMYDEEKNDLYAKFSEVSDFSKGYMDALVYTQKLLYGVDIIKGAIPTNIINELKEKVPYNIGDNKEGVETESYIYEDYFIKRKVTALERREVLQRVSDLYDTYLFSSRKPEYLPKVHYMGIINYYTQMPIVFKKTDINLNITLKSITTGIPVRILDIMGAGGFLLTNYQSEMEEYFKSGVEYDYYGDMQELEDKVKFYISHTEERQRIAEAGYEKVGKLFNYNLRLDEIMRLVKEN
nr:glycosyltransferase [uncultured Agathobacter sp.]